MTYCLSQPQVNECLRVGKNHYHKKDCTDAAEEYQNLYMMFKFFICFERFCFWIIDRLIDIGKDNQKLYDADLLATIQLDNKKYQNIHGKFWLYLQYCSVLHRFRENPANWWSVFHNRIIDEKRTKNVLTLYIPSE